RQKSAPHVGHTGRLSKKEVWPLPASLGAGGDAMSVTRSCHGGAGSALQPHRTTPAARVARHLHEGDHRRLRGGPCRPVSRGKPLYLVSVGDQGIDTFRGVSP